MAAFYMIFLLNSPPPELRDEIEEQLRALGFPLTDVEFSATAAPSRGAAVAIFWGGPNRQASVDQDAQRILDSDVPFLTVYRGQFAGSIPNFLGFVNGYDYATGSAGALAARALEVLGLVRGKRRVFVSYLRNEATAVARQMYEALDSRGYDVFLDTRTLLPGDEFQAELLEFIADSDLLVFLHSPGAPLSPWVEIELGLAEKLGIRMVEVLWPNVQQPRVSQLAQEFALPEALLTEVEVALPHGKFHQKQLSEALLAQFVAVAEGGRSKAMAARRGRVAGTFLTMAQADGLKVELEPVYGLTVAASPKIQLQVQLGVPNARDFQRVDLGHPNDRRGLLFDSTALTESSREHIDWLRQQASVELFDTKDLPGWNGTVEQWLNQSLRPNNPLKPVFLSASIPYNRDASTARYLADADRDAIREAVLALLRATLPRTDLYYGGHPAITPFVAQVALEDKHFERVHVYQSKRFERDYPKENRLFRNVELVPWEPGEETNESLLRMREKMLHIHSPSFFSAAFFIGGMNGVEDEFDLMKRYHPRVPRFVVATTGGAATYLYEERPESELAARYRGELGKSRVYGPLFRRILLEIMNG